MKDCEFSPGRHREKPVSQVEPGGSVEVPVPALEQGGVEATAGNSARVSCEFGEGCHPSVRAQPENRPVIILSPDTGYSIGGSIRALAELVREAPG